MIENTQCHCISVFISLVSWYLNLDTKLKTYEEDHFEL